MFRRQLVHNCCLTWSSHSIWGQQRAIRIRVRSDASLWIIVDYSSLSIILSWQNQISSVSCKSLTKWSPLPVVIVCEEQICAAFTWKTHLVICSFIFSASIYSCQVTGPLQCLYKSSHHNVMKDKLHCTELTDQRCTVFVCSVKYRWVILHYLVLKLM